MIHPLANAATIALLGLILGALIETVSTSWPRIVAALKGSRDA